jgi:hypothetical protein
LVVFRGLKPVARRLRHDRTIVEVDYARGHGTLGPLLRAVEDLDGRLEQLWVDDDDASAAPGGTRHVRLLIDGIRPEDVDRLIASTADRPEISRCTLNRPDGSSRAAARHGRRRWPRADSSS